MPRTLLLTGAAGQVAHHLRPLLRARDEQLILTDRLPVNDVVEGEEFRLGNLDDAGDMARVCAGVDAIIHLGGQPHEADWSIVDASNVQSMVQLLSAAHAAGVSRIIFASSNHVTGMYPVTQSINTTAPVRPDTCYGLSKAFGEALCSLFADKHGMRCLSVRIGNVSLAPTKARHLSLWLHPSDFFQLIEIGLDHPDLHNEIVYGVSDNVRSFYDNSAATRLGYIPLHRAEDYADAVLATEQDPDKDPIGDRLQGGLFCTRDFDGDLTRTLKS